ncbi:MAG TPA: hypothetical protein VFK03_04785, partial [Candidatus Saccharimonadales bacterium]|nr:hypothetical protein [Candidatus Saccharimonadales bacterium]
ATSADGANYGGYNDWFLPSSQEMSSGKAVVSDMTGSYWTSTAVHAPDAPSIGDYYAIQSNGAKARRDTSYSVRPVREFTGNSPALGSYSMTTTVIVGSGVGVGNPLAAENKPLDLPTLTPLTLRIAVRVDGSSIDTGGQNFKLQYAVKTGVATCSAVNTINYQDVTTATEIAYYDDSRYASGGGIVDNPNDPTDGSRQILAQTYQESNTNFTNSVSPLYAGQDGMWQFSLVINNATLKGRDFCLRIATSGGSVLTALNVADVAYAPQMQQLMRGGEWFDRSGKAKHISL